MTESRPAKSESLPRAVPIVFGPAEGQLFGFHHAPDPAVARATAIVLCNPVGYEAMCAHRTYRHLAEQLAAAGIHVLRFDYHGTGDSSGDLDEPERVSAWLDSIGLAIDALRAISGVPVVDLFGVRLGATLAAVVASRRDDVRSLVLWGPCVTGRAYVRELRAFRRIKQAEGAASAPAEDADEEIAGYLYQQTTVRDLSAIDLLAEPSRIAARALVLPRDDLPGGEQRLTAHLETSGVETTFREAPGYAGMMRDPQDTIVPFETLDAIVEWVRGSDQPGSVCASAPVASPPVLTAFSRAPRRRVREEALHFGEGGRLFGILTEAEGARRRVGRPAVLFVNVGANHRVGPHRTWVTLARDLAARGYLSFRFDLAGLGDSSIADGASENRLYSKDSIGDVRAAISLIAKMRGVERVVCVGLCSGAYLAFHATMDDPRVAGQILINPQTFEWKENDSIELATRSSYKSTRYYMGALLSRQVWAQALRGGVDFRNVAGIMRERLTARAGAGLLAIKARLVGRPPPRSDVEKAFCAMSDRGIESLLVFSSSDGGLDMIEKHLGRDARKMRGRKNTRFEVVEGADHTFTLAQSQRDLHALVTGMVEDAFP